ncbi:spermidine synthase [Cellulomonas soli]|uniref:spermidine synthase n=1 Tax=Cellulomonas soli TaxID=931535 RepID=UPI003F87FDBB
MAARQRSTRRPAASHRAPTRTPWPVGPVAVPTGTVELLPDPDDPDGVTLLVNGVPSSYLDLRDPTRLAFEYMQQMAAVIDGLGEGTDPLTVVHLGAAGCALARAIAATRPASRQVAVELDAALPELARDWFDLPRSPALRIRAGDARAELARLPTASADVVVRDVFAGDRTPEHVTTTEFTADVARVLRPGGVYLANCADRPPLALARAEAATLFSHFTDVAVVAEPGLLRGRGYGNVVLAASDDTLLLSSARLARAVRSLPAPARLLHGAELTSFVGSASVLRDPPVAPA